MQLKSVRSLSYSMLHSALTLFITATSLPICALLILPFPSKTKFEYHHLFALENELSIINIRVMAMLDRWKARRTRKPVAKVSRLMALPSELLLIIYAHLFDESLCHKLWYQPAHTWRHSRYRFKAGDLCGNQLISILYVCRQITLEATPVFWKLFAETYVEKVQRHRSPISSPILGLHRVSHMRSLAANLQRYAPDRASKLPFAVGVMGSRTGYSSLRTFFTCSLRSRRTNRKWNEMLELLHENALILPSEKLHLPTFLLDERDSNYRFDLEVERDGFQVYMNVWYISLSGPLAKLDWGGSDA